VTFVFADHVCGSRQSETSIDDGATWSPCCFIGPFLGLCTIACDIVYLTEFIVIYFSEFTNNDHDIIIICNALIRNSYIYSWAYKRSISLHIASYKEVNMK